MHAKFQLTICTKSLKLLFRNWCNVVGICAMADARSVWKLVTFDLDFWPWHSYFSNSCYIFRVALPSNFILVGIYIFRISRSQLSFKVKVTAAKKRLRATQKLLVGNCWDLIGISVTITLEVIWSFRHFDLDLWLWDMISYLLKFMISVLKALKQLYFFSVKVHL